MINIISKPTDDYDPLWPEYWVQNPELLRSAGAEAAEGGDGGSEGGDGSGEDAAAEEAKKAEAAVKAEAGEKKGEEGDGKKGDKGADWRAGITNEDARKFADSSTDVNHLAERALEMRQKLATAIIRPGKDAKDEEVLAYRKALGIPETHEGYKFPDLPEGQKLTDEIKASRELWGKRFHESDVPTEAAENLITAFNEDLQKGLEAQAAADKKYADEQSEALKTKWGDDYEKNKNAANFAANELWGDTLDEVRKIETKDGRFVLDDARMLKGLAKVGLEMKEGSLGGTLTEGERDSAEVELKDVRKLIDEAQDKGDQKEANRLYQKEQTIIAKLSGTRPIVGAQGRAA